MIQNGYEENISIKYSDIEQNHVLKPYALLNFLQDIASKNAEDLGFGYSYLHPKNYAWFLIKYHMEFEEYPADIQKITLKTESRGYKKLFAYRDFEIYSCEKLLGRIISTWSIVERNSRVIVSPSDAFKQNSKIQLMQHRIDDLSYTKISPLNKPVIEKEFEVRYNDLDINGHANNGNYIVWALEPLSFEFKNQHRIKTLDLVYKKEVKYGEQIISKVEFKNPTTTIHCLQNSKKEDLFLLECCWV